jgi:hypothetical protein
LWLKNLVVKRETLWLNKGNSTHKSPQTTHGKHFSYQRKQPITTQTVRTMKNALVFTALLFSLSLHAQKIATWKGGAPGHTTDWNYPANWEENRVPNEFSQVIIPDVSSSTFSNPVLDGEAVEIWSLQIFSGASLRIGKSARLIVTGQDSRAFMAMVEGEVRPGTTANNLVFASR